MSDDINLFDLVNLSLGTPEVGAVNFNALHTLLHSILKHLKIQNLTIERREWDEGQDPRSHTTSVPREIPSPYHYMADTLLYLKKKIAALERLPSGKELLLHTASGTTTSVNDMWQMMQLRRKVELNEDGVSRCMELIQDLLQEIQGLQETRDNLKTDVMALQNQIDQINMDQLECRLSDMEQYCHHVDDLENSTKELKQKVAMYPHPEEFSQCVTWEVMEAILVHDIQKMKKDQSDRIQGTKPPAVSTEVTPFTAGVLAIACLPSMSDSDSTDLGGPSGIPLPHLLTSSISSGADHYPETVEALRDIGRLLGRHGRLEARVEHLELNKADQVQVQQLREILSSMGEKSTPENILEQVDHLMTLIDTLNADKETVSKLECAVDVVSVSERTDVGEVVTQSESWSSQEKSSISVADLLQQQLLQIADLRKSVQKLEEEVENLKKDVIALRMEQKSPDNHLQDQPDNLHSMLEDIMMSSSAMMSWSVQQERAEGNQDQEGETVAPRYCWGQAAGQGNPGVPSGQAGHMSPSSMVDMSRKVSQLFQRYEKLHGMVTGFIKQQGCDRTEQRFGISSELISHMQERILQLQVECEKLHNTTSQLMEAHIQKQSRIDHLYQTIGELEEKKADREVVEMEIGVKADKQALETKVSKIQYDAMTEQLYGMFQELLNKVTGQEQDWHKVIKEISTEMECKLNRLELDPLKKHLEDRWKSIHMQLQAQPPPEHDDAAGLRKQLVARFHCISCDHPVDLLTPGPDSVTVPLAPRLPSHRSNRPHTIYDPEYVRRHSRRPGTNQAHYEKACLEKGLAQMRYIHSMMCRQIDRVQRNIGSTGTLEPPHGLRDITPLIHPPTMGSLQKTGRNTPKQCGGSHTLRSTNRPFSHLQHITHQIQTEEAKQVMCGSDLQVQSEEVNIRGLDGHIYKGHLNNRAVKTVESRLPSISTKEGKATLSLSNPEDHSTTQVSWTEESL